MNSLTKFISNLNQNKNSLIKEELKAEKLLEKGCTE